MKKLYKIFFAIIFLFIFNYLIFSDFKLNNLKKISAVYSLGNNFSEYTFNTNNIKIDEKSIYTITVYDEKTKSKVYLFDSNDNVIKKLNNKNCILKESNKCTYLINHHNVNKIKVKGNIKKIAINEKKSIYNLKNSITLKLIILLIIYTSIIYLTKYLYKIKIDKIILDKIKKITIDKTFIILATIIGITFSILYPLYQIPDELTHINFVYSERNLDIKFNKLIGDYGVVDEIATHPNKIVNSKKYFDLSKKIDYGLKISVPKILIIRHFPQYIGMLLGEILHLPVLLFVTLCEICALIFYIFVCTKALKKMPIKKHLFMFIMLLPVCSQQMASFSYDVVLNCFCFLLTASILEVKIKEKKVHNKDLLKIMLMLMVIGICKLPYVLIGLLIFIIPLKSFEIELFNKKISPKNSINKHKIPSIILISSFIILFIFMMYKLLLKMSIGRVLIAALTHPLTTINLYTRTVKIHLLYYFETIVGNLGWFDVKISALFEIFVYFVLFILTFYKSNEITNKFNNKDLVVFYIISLILIFIIILSMFEWTLMCTGIENYESFKVKEIAHYMKIIPYIGGVQGRYFIPVIPLILIPISSLKLSKKVLKINPIFLQMVYYIIFFIYITTILINRYWI